MSKFSFSKKNVSFTVLVALLISSILLTIGCSCGGGMDEVESMSSAEVPPELLQEYDVFSEDEVSGPPNVDTMTPRQGSTGTIITITGSNFGNTLTGTDLTIGTQPLEIVSWTDQAISAKVLPGTTTGTVKITTQGGTNSGYEFEILPESKTLLTSMPVDSSTDSVIETGTGLTIAVPSGAVQSNDTLSVSAVENGPAYNSLFFDAGKMYAIEMDSETDLTMPVALEFDLEPGQNPGDTLVCYYDESTGEWVNVPAVYDIENGKIAVITNHFSHWLLVHARTGGAFLSDDYFIIAYTPGDTVSVPGISTIEELAVTVSDYLKEAYLKYRSTLGETYVKSLSEKTDGDVFEKFAQSQAGRLLTEFTSLEQTDLDALADVVNLRDRVIVELSSKHNGYGGSAGFSIKWSQHTVFLPTSYPDIDTVKITAAHELFHNIQSYTFFSMEMDGFWHHLDNKWLIEATAEYAAWGIAFPETKPAVLHEYTRSTLPYNYFSNREDGQEYGMSFFIDYALQHGDKNFKTLYRYMVDNRPSIGLALEKYIKDKTGSTVSILYREFWQDLFTLSGMPKYVKVPDLLLPLGVRNQTEQIEAKKKIAVNTVRSYFTYPSFPANCENLVVCIAAPNGKMPEGTCVSIAQIENFTTNDLTTRDSDTFGERTAQSPQWTLITSSGITTHRYITFDKDAFTEENKQAALLVFETWAEHDPITMDIGYITMDVSPKNLDKVQVGENIDFTATISNIFKQAKTMQLVWDFGDGYTETEDYPAFQESIKNTVTHKYGQEGNYTVKVSLYDTQNGKQLIAERIIELGQGVTLTIDRQPEEPGTDDEVKLSANGKEDWYYKWEFGDLTREESSGTSITHKYGYEGRFTVSVTAYKDQSKKEVTGFGTATVVVDNKLLELWITPSSNLEATVGDLVEIGVELADKTKQLENYRIYWIAKDSDEMIDNGTSLMLSYNKIGTYSIEVKAMDDYGNVAGSGSAVIEIVQPGEDPYRKYDSGFFQYDYDLLYYEIGDTTVTYKRKDTDEREGLEITFTDETLTIPDSARYYKEDMTVDGYWYVGIEGYDDNGYLDYREYTYIKDGTKYYDQYTFFNGIMVRETHTVNDKFHGPMIDFYGIVEENSTGTVYRVEYYEGQKNGTEYKSFNDVVVGTEPAVWYSIIEYQDGQLHGYYRTFNSDGSPDKEYYYINGVLQSE